jgi:hypothetical protein
MVMDHIASMQPRASVTNLRIFVARIIRWCIIEMQYLTGRKLTVNRSTIELYKPVTHT